MTPLALLQLYHYVSDEAFPNAQTAINIGNLPSSQIE